MKLLVYTLLLMKQTSNIIDCQHCALDSEDDFCSMCRNVSRQQQFFSEVPSPGRSQNANYIEIFVIRMLLTFERL